MDEKLLESVLSRLKGTGKHDQIVKLLEIANEEELNAAIELLPASEKLTFSEIIKQPDYQGEFDKFMAKAQKTREDNLKKEFNFVKKDEIDDELKEKKLKGDSEMQKQLQELREMVMNQSKAQTLERNKLLAASTLKEKGIPAKFIRMIDFSDDAKDLSAQLTEIETDFKDLSQDIEKKVAPNRMMPFQTAQGGAIEKDVKAIIDGF